MSLRAHPVDFRFAACSDATRIARARKRIHKGWGGVLSFLAAFSSTKPRNKWSRPRPIMEKHGHAACHPFFLFFYNHLNRHFCYPASSLPISSFLWSRVQISMTRAKSERTLNVRLLFFDRNPSLLYREERLSFRKLRENHFCNIEFIIYETIWCNYMRYIIIRYCWNYLIHVSKIDFLDSFFFLSSYSVEKILIL